MSLSTSTPHNLFTIGHSNHAWERFAGMLTQHQVEVLVDVRSQPYSQYTPHFNHDQIAAALAAADVRYLFLGQELGGRPNDERFYDAEGHVLYAELAKAPLFLQGLDRLQRGIERFRVTLMCSEEDPTVCHRFLLVSRVLADRGVGLQHIRGDGRLQSQRELVVAPSGGQKLLFPESESKP